MPKFNGQNKKRINPRYFLNETTHRGELNEGLMSPGQVEYWSSQIFFYIGKNKNRPEFSSMQQELNDVAERASAARAKRGGGLSSEELKPLIKAMGTSGSFQDFANAVASISGTSTADVDGDGTSDADELMKIAQGMKNKNYGLTSSVMQDDDNIPVSKKIPSGLS